MKHSKKIVLTAIATAVITMTGCSTTGGSSGIAGGNQIDPGTRSGQSISDQRLAVSDFKRQGVKIGYTFGGDVEYIETTGYAPVWGNSQNAAREAYRVAELEAKKSLNDFINKETISSTTSVKMISQNLEHAQDQKTNRFASNKAVVASDDDAANSDTSENQAIRNDGLKIASKLSTEITTQNRGIIGGLYLVEGSVINDGKNVQVVMRWDKKHQQSRVQIRNLMAQ